MSSDVGAGPSPLLPPTSDSPIRATHAGAGHCFGPLGHTEDLA